MKQFKDFTIKSLQQSFTGDKIKIDRILNRTITVLDYKIEKSKYAEKGNGQCLHLQIELNGTKQVIFTGSKVLMDTITQIERSELPFETVIRRENEHFEFS